ncbi:MAG: HAMP domain-containing histidine kinase [Candidatus Marinimicrobia bacterium]|jgi:signal transduction histidine kinase|nr:HAMP domain-containing histidine kinase [Candidatus Neomarinimicrobiota bacterium]
MEIKIYRHSGNIKRMLFVLAIVMIFALLNHTQKLVRRLRQDSANLIRFYADVYAKAAMDMSGDDFSFIFEEIIQKISTPMILTSKEFDEPTAWRNIGIPDNDNSPESLAKVKAIMVEMDRENEPIPLVYGDRVLQYIHFGDTNMIYQLRRLPYIEIAIVGLFIFLGYIGFSVIRDNEKRSIWVGMAKETAHQLGTPLTALMGWLELLKDEIGENANISEISRDIQRLEKVANRFSQIGSRPILKSTDVNSVINDAVTYYRRRLPQLGPGIKLEFVPTAEYTVNLNADLFSWALENLIKNAIDAVSQENGRIIVEIQPLHKGKSIAIDVIDNGKGIYKRNRKNIFRPGYSTKQRGWGLGLSLAMRIIKEYHRGRLFVLASKPYEKTVLRIVLKNTQ